MRCRDWRFFIAMTSVVSLLGLGGTAVCSADDEKPQETTSTRVASSNQGRGPQVQVPQAEPPPTIDGALDDACWTKSAVYDDFYCPEYDGAAPEKTTVRVTADGKALYVGVVCEDRTPGDIIANETRRNGDIGNEDTVGVLIDPSGQHRDFYSFRVTARGTQREDMPGGSATKIEWRGDWSAAARRTEGGWTAEMAIPFTALRCPPGPRVMAFYVQRSFGRERVSVVWPSLGRASDSSLCASLLGVCPVAQPKRIVWMPYATADGGDTPDGGFDAGLDVQYKLPNGLTALGTINPDFKQVEDVVEPISFSYTERYLADPRPFFVTGQEGYLPREHLFYTRRIGDFDAGLKLFGTMGKDTIGLLDAVRYGDENALAAAWTRQFDEDTRVKGMLVSHRQVGEPVNLAFGIDAFHSWRQPDGKGKDGLWSVLYFSQDGDLGSGSSLSVGGMHDRGPGRIQYDWMLRQATPEFHPALGYYTDVNNHGGSFNLQEIWLYEKGPIFARQWTLSTDYYPYLEGEGIYYSRVSPQYAFLTRGGQLWVASLELTEDHRFDSSGAMLLHAWRDQDTYHRGEVMVLRGKRAGGDYTFLHLTQRLKPMEKMCLSVEGAWARLEMPDPAEGSTDYQAILTATYDITTEKSAALRAVYTGHRGTSIYAAYRQVVRKGMDAYVILGDPDPERTGFAKRGVLKLIWAF